VIRKKLMMRRAASERIIVGPPSLTVLVLLTTGRPLTGLLTLTAWVALIGLALLIVGAAPAGRTAMSMLALLLFARESPNKIGLIFGNPEKFSWGALVRLGSQFEAHRVRRVLIFKIRLIESFSSLWAKSPFRYWTVRYARWSLTLSEDVLSTLHCEVVTIILISDL
jgi:hypothetical protein